MVTFFWFIIGMLIGLLLHAISIASYPKMTAWYKAQSDELETQKERFDKLTMEVERQLAHIKQINILINKLKP